MKDQIDKNYGRIGGWLLSFIWDGALVYSEWSAR